MSRIACLAAFALLANACARSNPEPASPPAPRSAPGAWDAAPRPAPAPPIAGYADGAPSRREAKASRGAADAAASQAASESEESRPGLGTEWGETRSSRVSTVAFERDGNTPFASTAVYYNDADGVRAMTRGAAFGMPARADLQVARGALTVRLLDSSGNALPTYDLGARSYVVGRDGERYSIEIENHTGNRIEAVASVDGLDVMDGRAGSYEKRGYLIGPWARVEIDGFRRSLAEVAAFRFGSVENSYAAQTGEARNVGVIGVAFFAEEGASYPWLERESERRHDADPFPGRFAQPPR